MVLQVIDVANFKRTIPFDHFILGLLSWQAIIYLDVVKSRIQADSVTNPKYKGTWDCFRQSYQRDGLRVFLRGFTMMSLRAFPLNGATFLGFEYSMKILHQINIQ